MESRDFAVEMLLGCC